MAKAKVLYGTIDPSMDEFDKIRERVRARLIAMNYPAYNAYETASDMALRLELADYTDDQLLEADAEVFAKIVSNAFGHADKDYTVTLQEAYGKIDS